MTSDCAPQSRPRRGPAVPRAGLTRLAVALALLAATTAARADETSAAETFQAGLAAYERGEYRAAALAFEAAFREQPHAAALYNAGRSWSAAGALPRAADAYAAALRERGLDATQEADAGAQLRALTASLGAVAVTAPPGVFISIEHVDRAAAPLLVHVTPGEHTARAHLPDGRALERTVRVGPGERIALAFTAPPPAAPPAGPGAAPPTGSPTAPEPDAAPPSAGPSALQIVGWGSLAGATLATGTAIFLGVRALDARDAFNASNHTDAAAHDRAASLRTWTNVTWAAAGALAATGAVLLLALPSRPGARAALHVTPGGAAVSGSF